MTKVKTIIYSTTHLNVNPGNNLPFVILERIYYILSG